MTGLKNTFRKIKREARILFEQKTGWIDTRHGENISKNLIKKYLPQNPVIIDCGANNGNDTVELARIIANSTVHAFEPIPETFEALKNATRKYKNIICYQVALSNQTGKAEMHVASGVNESGSSSLLAPKSHLVDYPHIAFNKKIEVATITLDDWASQNNVDHVDLLWLDMQGFEMPMLKSSKKILPAVKAILTEVSLTETYNGVATYPVYKAYLQGEGFK
jgi:FkbM family methyltransferase